VFEWMLEAGQLDLPTGLVDAETIAATPPQISGARGGRTLSYQDLAQRGATLVGRVIGARGSVLDLSDDVGSNIRFADEVSLRLRARWGTDANARRTERDDADAPAPHLYGSRGPRTLDLSAANITTIIWATGFRPSTDWLPDGALDLDHRPRLPGLHVVGAPWLTHRSSANLYGIAADAKRVAQRIASTGVPKAA
jgi:putative flavoprotein involved in K+ transport